MRTGLVVIAAFVAAASACGPGTQSQQQGGEPSVVVVERSPSEVTTEIVGATPEQREILVEALAGIGETKIDKIEVSPAEKGWVDDPDAVGLTFSAGGGELDVRTTWESWLVTQALAVRSSELGLPVIAYSGGRGIGGSAVGKESARKPNVATDAEVKSIVQRIEVAARKAKAEVEAIEVLQPFDSAVAMTFRVADPAQFLDERVETFFEALEPADWPRERADYLRFVDANGSRIMEIAGAEVGGGSSGTGWVRPDLIGCYYPGLSRPTHWKPPPCPSDSERSKPDVNPQPPVVSTEIVGATPKQEAVLRQILAGLAPTIIDEVRIAPARAPWTPYKPDSVIVSVRYADSPEKGRGEWEASLLAYAFATRSRLMNLQPVAGYESAGDALALDGPEEPELDTRRPIDKADLAEALSDAARSSGAEIVDLRILQPMNLAVVLTLRVKEPASYLKHRLEGFEESLPSDVRVDGYHIRIVDQEDRFVWYSASSGGDTVGGYTGWARKDLQGCDPTPRFGGPQDQPPPPCPAD